MVANYGNESLRTQSNKEAVRMNPQNFLGSDDRAGAFHTFKEILANSVDEANSSYGKEINIKIHEDNSITIQDFGRGVPMDFNKSENKYNWEIVFNILHGGGKFKSDRSNYNSSLGQNGLGSALMQLSSEYCKVVSIRDGYRYEMNFEKGEPVGSLKKEKSKEKTGTTITWKPDLEVFTEIEFDVNETKEWIKLQSIVNSGIKFHFVHEVEEIDEEYSYSNGIFDYVKELSEDNSSIDFMCSGIGKDTPSRPAYKVEGNVSFAFIQNKEPLSLYFHNSNPLEYGGSPKKAMESAFVDFFTKVLKKDGLKKELTFEDIKDNLIFISATYTQVPPSFENQTKKAISNKFIQEFLYGQILNKLSEWSNSNEMEFNKISSQIKINCESRHSAVEHRKITKQKLTKSVSGMKNRIENYIDCKTNDVSKKELYLCEGKSAAGSIKQARNEHFQAIYPLRGKIKSVYKTNAADALSSEAVKNIIQLIGTGINHGKSKCVVEDRKFDKIIFATDQDLDAKHIKSLLLTLFYVFMPELIKGGHLYSLETPLFEIEYKDGTYKYVYTDLEKEKAIKEKPVKNINRNKGLGEVSSDVMSRCLNPDTRHLIQYNMEDAEHAMRFMDLFMGKDSEVRKEYIMEHADEYEIDNE